VDRVVVVCLAEEVAALELVALLVPAVYLMVLVQMEMLALPPLEVLAVELKQEQAALQILMEAVAVAAQVEWSLNGKFKVK